MQASRGYEHLTIYAIVGVLARVLVAVRNNGYFIDDTYIYWRYAENLSLGNGLVFNIGERVMGFTSPLFMVFVAIINTLLPTSVYSIAWIMFGVACFVVSLVLLHKLVEQATSLGKSIALICLSLYFPFIDSSIQGMETSLFLLAILLCIWTATSLTSSTAFGLSLALVVLVRPEGIFVALPAYIYVLYKSKIQAIKALAIGILPGIIWAIAAYSYYGSVIPNSAIAKGLTPEAGVKSLSDAGLYFMCLLGGLSDSHKDLLPDQLYIAFLITSVVAVAVVFLRIQKSKQATPMLAMYSLFLYIAFYFIGQPVRMFSWYGIPSCLLFVIVTVYSLPRSLPRKISIRTVQNMLTITIVIITIILANIRANGILSMVSKRYVNLSQWIENNTEDDEWICLVDIGYVGWKTMRPLLDLGGLVSPNIAESHANGDPILPILLSHDPIPRAIFVKNWNPNNSIFREGFMEFPAYSEDSTRIRFLRLYSRLPIEVENTIGISGYILDI